jgi:hypothetical protein
MSKKSTTIAIFHFFTIAICNSIQKPRKHWKIPITPNLKDFYNDSTKINLFNKDKHKLSTIVDNSSKIEIGLKLKKTFKFTQKNFIKIFKIPAEKNQTIVRIRVARRRVSMILIAVRQKIPADFSVDGNEFGVVADSFDWRGANHFEEYFIVKKNFVGEG